MNGAIKSAANIAHAQWLADGGTAATVLLEGTSIAMVNGYPDNAAIDLAAQVTATDYTVDDTTSTTATTFDVIGAPTPATCRVTYTEAAANGSPDYTLVITGC